MEVVGPMIVHMTEAWESRQLIWGNLQAIVDQLLLFNLQQECGLSGVSPKRQGGKRGRNDNVVYPMVTLKLG